MATRESHGDGARAAEPGRGGPPASALRRRFAGGGALIAFAAVLLAVLLVGGQREIEARLIGIHGRAQLRVSGGHAQLIVQDLTPPPTGQAYEVWLQPAHSPPLPTQVLFTASTGTLRVPDSLSGIRRVLVTEEPAAGSISPTGPTVIVARLG